MDQIAKDRDNLNLDVISLRRAKSILENQLQISQKKCREDFTESMNRITEVSRSFRGKIDSLFPSHIAFQLTCPKQREHLEQIRSNCTSLSMEVENTYQNYLNKVGEQVSTIQAQNARFEAENSRLSQDYRWCSQNRSHLIQEHKQTYEKLQLKYDKEKEKLLVDKMNLNGQIDVLQSSVNYKNKEVEHLAEQVKQLNMSCMLKVRKYCEHVSSAGVSETAV